MRKKIQKRIVKVRLGPESRYVEEGDTLEEFKNNFKKEFRLISNKMDYTLSCKDKAMRTIKIEEEKSYQNVKNVMVNYPNLIEPFFVPKEKIIHKNSTCSICGMSPIEGFRYKCLDCDSFDLCPICEKKEGEKHGHTLLKLRRADLLEHLIFFKDNENENEKEKEPENNNSEISQKMI